jgi:hypothetical protein
MDKRLLIKSAAALVASAGVGAAAMYLLDPELGDKRRDRTRRSATSAMGSAWGTVSDQATALSSKAKSLAQSLTGSARSDANDESAGGGWIGFTLKTIGILGVGAGLMFLLDPRHGHLRRQRVREQTASYARRGSQYVRDTARHLADRVRGNSHDRTWHPDTAGRAASVQGEPASTYQGRQGLQI